MPQAQYRVTAPDGHVLVLSGPENATDDEIQHQAQTLYKPGVALSEQPNIYQDASGKWIDRRASSEPATVAAQAKNYPTRPKFGVDSGENLTPAQVAVEQAKSVVVGGLQLPQTTFNAVRDLGKRMYDLATIGNPVAQAVGAGNTIVDAAKGAVEGVANPINTILRNVRAYDEAAGIRKPKIPTTVPTSEENRSSAEFAGANAAGLASAPDVAADDLMAAGKAIPPMLRKTAGAITTPEALMTRAAVNRAPVPPMNVAAEIGIPAAGSAVGYALGGTPGAEAGAAIAEALQRIRRSPLYRGMKADAQESLARYMVKNAENPSSGAIVSATLPTEISAEGRAELAQRALADQWANSPAFEPRHPKPEFLPTEVPMEGRSPVRPGQNDYRTQYSEPTPIIGEVPGNPRQFEQQPPGGIGYNPFSGDSRWPTVDLNLSPASDAVPSAPELNKWMNVKEKQMLYGKNPAEQILSENLLGADKAATLTNVEAARKSAGAQMEIVFKAAEEQGIRFDLDSEINQAVADAKHTYGKGSDEAFTKQLENLQDQFTAQNGDLRNATPSEAHTFEKDLGKGVNWEGNNSDLQGVMKDIRSRVDKLLKSKVDGLSPLKDRWGNLWTAEQALRSAIRNDLRGRGTGPMPPFLPR